jgi:hypothetical protein
MDTFFEGPECRNWVRQPGPVRCPKKPYRRRLPTKLMESFGTAELRGVAAEVEKSLKAIIDQAAAVGSP